MTESKSLLGSAVDLIIGPHTIKVRPPVLKWYLEALEIISSETSKEIAVKKGIFGRKSMTFADALEKFKKPSEKLLKHIAKTTDKDASWFIDNLTLLQAATFISEFLNVIDIDEVKKVFSEAIQKVKVLEPKQ